MNTRISKWILSMSILSVLMVISQPVYAYIDPGTGSMLVQAIIAFIAAAGVFLGMFWNHVKSLLKKLFDQKQESGDTPTDEKK